MSGKASPFRIGILGVGVLAFSNSFLMFFIQPMVAKALLPSFGGSAAVWTTVMLFFQLALVAGYGLTHVLRKLSGRRLTIFYGMLLAGSILGCRLNKLFEVETMTSPTWAVLTALLVTVGLPFLLLSATTPLLQMVLHRIDDREPYWLYGVSNLASLSALLCYPLLVEPYFKLPEQTGSWTIGFIALAIALFVMVTQLTGAGKARGNLIESDKSQVQIKWRVGWFIYPLLASIAFISFTAHLTADVAPVPMLWVLPLAIYLLSFVLVFAQKPFYLNRWTPFLCLGACGVQAIPYLGWGGLRVSVALPLALVCLFVICWFCHGKLIRLRPRPEGLTRFYLALSVGGAAGGFFCGVIAPLIFPDNFEMPLVLLTVGGIAFYEVVFGKEGLFSSGQSYFLLKVIPFSIAGLLVLCTGLWFSERQKDVLIQDRNFYGSVRIRQSEGYREMVHGRVVHGVQVMNPHLDLTPTAYFYEESAIAYVFYTQRDLIPTRGLRVGAIGLGVGTIASYNRPQDEMRFIELDGKIEVLAREYFTFLSRAQGDVDVVIGDGRKRLELFDNASLDILILDAFTGDSVPTHLLTSEAFEKYAEKISPKGMLVCHISNNHLELARLMAGLAIEHQWQLRLVNTPGKEPYGGASQYAVFAREGVQMPAFSHKSFVFGLADIDRPELWTDHRNNLIQIMKW